jgi:hypothetical protein
MSVTYTAALNRMIELANMVGNTTLAAELAVWRDLNLAGIAQHFLVTSKAGPRYMVRSVDPGTGMKHGVLGQTPHGYYEASCNHDAVAFRIVDDALAEEFMSIIDSLGDKIRPNTFILPNTDAGGGVGYDDMLCGSGATCGGIFEYGTWVNGGVWSTQEARAILAYYRTGRPHLAAASMQCMLDRFSSSWQMDAPLPDFGTKTWKQGVPTVVTIDAFGVGSALLRGLFEWVASPHNAPCPCFLLGLYGSHDAHLLARYPCAATHHSSNRDSDLRGCSLVWTSFSCVCVRV